MAFGSSSSKEMDWVLDNGFQKRSIEVWIDWRSIGPPCLAMGGPDPRQPCDAGHKAGHKAGTVRVHFEVGGCGDQ